MIIAPFSHARVTKFDALAEIPIFGSITSAARIPYELLSILSSLLWLPCSCDSGRTLDSIRVSFSNLGKALVELTPIIGNVAAFYLNRATVEAEVLVLDSEPLGALVRDAEKKPEQEEFLLLHPPLPDEVLDSRRKLSERLSVIQEKIYGNSQANNLFIIAKKILANRDDWGAWCKSIISRKELAGGAWILTPKLGKEINDKIQEEWGWESFALEDVGGLPAITDNDIYCSVIRLPENLVKYYDEDSTFLLKLLSSEISIPNQVKLLHYGKERRDLMTHDV